MNENEILDPRSRILLGHILPSVEVFLRSPSVNLQQLLDGMVIWNLSSQRLGQLPHSSHCLHVLRFRCARIIHLPKRRNLPKKFAEMRNMFVLGGIATCSVLCPIEQFTHLLATIGKCQTAERIPQRRLWDQPTWIIRVDLSCLPPLCHVFLEVVSGVPVKNSWSGRRRTYGNLVRKLPHRQTEAQRIVVSLHFLVHLPAPLTQLVSCPSYLCCQVARVLFEQSLRSVRADRESRACHTILQSLRPLLKLAEPRVQTCTERTRRRQRALSGPPRCSSRWHLQFAARSTINAGIKRIRH
mmetsp:Transcript_49248/g.130436  ORF Transcript_49248/g.130436 Transcript_49248/m.130436 type:complete len:298 (-) Transcript_49248:95-988(-)